MATNPHAIRPLADDYVTLYESPSPDDLWCYSPGIAVVGGADGRIVATTGLGGDTVADPPAVDAAGAASRLVATIDLGGPGAADLPGPKVQRGEGGRLWQGKVFTSDDRGRTWTHRTDFPFMHARPFVAGESVYVLGQGNDLIVMRSDDSGETWGEPSKLTDGEHWHQAPSNVHCANGCAYLVMEKRITFDSRAWSVCEMAPVLLRGRLDDDLTLRESWTFASELSFRDALEGADSDPATDYFGVPFYPTAYPGPHEVAPGRQSAPIGWLETNVVQFVDSDHCWHDPSGRTLHLWARAHTGGTGYACVAKVVEEAPGSGAMTTVLQTVPSGKTALYVSCPGGQMKFHVLYDDRMALYWLLSTQATDSMTRADLLPPDRYNLPNNERRRLQLHFSKNMIDWCFAGLVAVGPCERGSRHYASMVIDGDDIHVLSRSGDERASNAHNGNIITFHTVRDFRSLVY